jgi:hypothetical protein
VCEAGTEMCSGGNTAVLTCNADGTMQTTEACASGSTCVVDGTMAACRAVVCTAGEMGCTNDQTRYACDATGTTRDDGSPDLRLSARQSVTFTVPAAARPAGVSAASVAVTIEPANVRFVGPPTR